MGHESDLAKGTNHRERRGETLTAEGCGSAFSLLPFAPWWIFCFSCSLYLLLRALTWLVKINLHARRGKRTVVSLAGTTVSCAFEGACASACVCVCVCVSFWTELGCDSSCGGQADSTGITTASHTKPSETMQCCRLAALYTQHHSKHPGEATEVACETHMGTAGGCMSSDICLLMCACIDWMYVCGCLISQACVFV